MSQVVALHTHLVSPRVKKHLPRPRLIARLRNSLHHRLTLVCAPAGAGKTTLLRDFAQSIHVPVVWCQLDRSDRDPAVLTGRILSALNAEPEPIKLLDGAPPQAWEIQSALLKMVHLLSENARAGGGHLIVILDDYHKVDANDAIKELMTGTIELVSPGVHLVIASRSLPLLPLSRLRLQGDLLELTQEDLVLDMAEVSAFLANWGVFGLSEEEMRLVLDKTGGWVAGISMLAQSLRTLDKREVIAFLRDFGGSSARIYDYFAEEVMQQQPAAVQQQLMAMSLLDELHRDLVNGLLGIGDAQRLLESLAANNVFIVCLDETRDWYRFHPLFRDFLKTRAQRNLSQVELGSLHRRAAKMYALQANWGRAIEHLCSAGSFMDAVAIIERMAEEYLERGNLESVKHWLACLPDGLRHERPRLLMIDGVVAQRQGRYHEAMRALTRAQELFTEIGDSSGLASAAAERAMVSYRLGNYREAVDLLECSLAAASENTRRAAILGWLCINYKELGQLERSAQVGEAALEALASYDAEPRPGLQSRTLRILAQTYTLRGDLDRALSMLLRADELASRERFGELELAWVKCSLGVIRAVRGEANQALQELAEAEDHGASYIEPLRRRLNLWKGNVFTDLGNFGRAEQCYETAGFPPAERAWLHVRQHQPGRAILIARDALHGVSPNEPLQRACLTAVLGLALSASGKEMEALRLLHQADALFAAGGYIHHSMSVGLHLARLLGFVGQADRKNQMLRETLQTSASRGFFHFYWWDPQVMTWLQEQVSLDLEARCYIELLAEKHRYGGNEWLLPGAADGRSRTDDTVGSKARIHRDSADALTPILASCTDPVAKGRILRATAADPLAAKCVIKLRSDFQLTWREVEVFVAYYLDRRLSIHKELGPRRKLAIELCMSENTLKSHVKRIRRKLDLPDNADSLQVFSRVIGYGPGSILS